VKKKAISNSELKNVGFFKAWWFRAWRRHGLKPLKL